MARLIFAGPLLLLGISGCTSIQTGEVELAARLSYVRNHYTEPSSLVPLEGRLELSITPSGDAQSLVQRPNLSDVKRSGRLSAETRSELRLLLDRWTSTPKEARKPSGRSEGVLTYGEARDEWKRDAVLPDALSRLVQCLEKINASLATERTR